MRIGGLIAALLLLAAGGTAGWAADVPTAGPGSVGAAGNSQDAQQQDDRMILMKVELVPKPMIFVASTSSMDPSEIAQAMATSFEKLGAFMKASQVVPLGPPLGIYRNWTAGRMTLEVGFPVAPADASKAAGEVQAGQTPSGFALKAIHRGSYDSLHDTYAAIQSEMLRAGVAQGNLMWEVYFGEPGVTPEADLVTEIYTQISAEDAARFPPN